MNEHWRISDLRTIVARALMDASYLGASSGRIRIVPDTRTIRYYTTIGLIDRPAEMRGRTAFYSQRHVLQVVAIKRLQAEGKSLSEIQKHLAGATTRTLKRIANLPADFWQHVDRYLKQSSGESIGDSNGAVATTLPVVSRQDDFWQTPVDVEQVVAKPIQSIRLPIAPGVSLTVDDISDDHISTLSTQRFQQAIQNFKNELKVLGLTAKDNGAKIDQPTDRSSDHHQL